MLPAVLATFVFGGRAPTMAQQIAYAREGGRPVPALTRQSLECLRRGEAAATDEERLAAYREGLSLARQAIAEDDRDADAHFAAFANNGRILLIEGVTANFINLLKASEELDRCLEINPNHADAVGAKGGLYRQLPWMLGGSQKKAEVYLSRAIELDPSTILPRIELAEVYRDQGHPERSVPLLEQAVVLGARAGKTYRVAQARKLLAEIGDKE